MAGIGPERTPRIDRGWPAGQEDFGWPEADSAAPGGRIPLLPGDLRVLTVEGDRLSDHLDDRRRGRLGELLGGGLRLHLDLPAELHLHQLAGAKGVVQRLDERRRETVLADVHGRGQVVRLGAERGAILSGE